MTIDFGIVAIFILFLIIIPYFIILCVIANYERRSLKKMEEDMIKEKYVKHAHWIQPYPPSTERTCSACGGDVGAWHMFADCTYDYCPWCGARMDGERDE